MTTLSDTIEKLKTITQQQQDLGTAKLALAGIEYNDGTIQGVMENIPKGGGGTSVYVKGIVFSSVPALGEALINGQGV